MNSTGAGRKAARVEDRRVERTRHALREALIVLIVERGWDAIAVREICDRANVGRSTFYAHFADKEQLLISGFEDLRRGLRAATAASAGEHAPLAFTRPLIEHAHGQRRWFRALLGRRSGEVVQRRFRQFVSDLVGEDLAALEVDESRRESATRFLAGAFVEMLLRWLDSRSPAPPATLDGDYRRLATPVLASLRGRA